ALRDGHRSAPFQRQDFRRPVRCHFARGADFASAAESAIASCAGTNCQQSARKGPQFAPPDGLGPAGGLAAGGARRRLGALGSHQRGGGSGAKRHRDNGARRNTSARSADIGVAQRRAALEIDSTAGGGGGGAGGGSNRRGWGNSLEKANCG